MSSEFRDFLNEQLKDPEFAKEYYATKPEVDFSIVIHQIREEKGLTQVELAELSGVNQANISRIENGERLPNIYTLQKIILIKKNQESQGICNSEKPLRFLFLRLSVFI